MKEQMMSLGMITQMPCSQKRMTSGLAGAAVAYFALDTMFPAPKWAHYALAGLAIDMTCRGADITKGGEEAVQSAAYGVAGAVGAGLLLGRGLSF